MATINGTSGADVLRGTTSADIIIGGPGVDIMTGGDGADTFVFKWHDGGPYKPNDQISDFKVGVDKLALPGAINGTWEGNGGLAVRYGDWDDWVWLPGVHKTDIPQLTAPTGSTPTTDPVKAPPPPTAPVTPVPDPNPAPPSGSGDLPDHRTIIHETFDGGRTGIFTNTWGNVARNDGEVVITSKAGQWWDAGLMIGKEKALGYGLYEFQLHFNKNTPGGYALLWPQSDKWPGPEVDNVEVLRGGQGYATVHWDNGGRDAYKSYMMPSGVDFTKPHTVAVDWQKDHLDFFLDGQRFAHVTEHVPRAAVDGGQNELPAFGVQTSWNQDAQGGTDFKLHAMDFQYSVIA